MRAVRSSSTRWRLTSVTSITEASNDQPSAPSERVAPDLDSEDPAVLRAPIHLGAVDDARREVVVDQLLARRGDRRGCRD